MSSYHAINQDVGYIIYTHTDNHLKVETSKCLYIHITWCNNIAQDFKVLRVFVNVVKFPTKMVKADIQLRTYSPTQTCV